MKPTIKQFNGKKLRAVYNKDKKTWLVSVIDLISAITNADYDTSRNYWKQLKYRLKSTNHPITKKTRQIKLIAKDGLYRNTDVMDYKEIARLIQCLPYKTAAAAKNWIANIACRSTKLAKDLTVCLNRIMLPKKYCFITHTSIKKIF